MKTILMVDDDMDHSLCFVLRDEGYRVVTAENGLDGLDRAKEFNPQLVLLDFMMPNMDGGCVGHSLRGARRHQSIRILMSSSLSEESVKERFDDYDAFLRKPYGIDEALTVITRLLAL